MEHSYTILNHKTDFRFILHHICLLVIGLQNMHSFSVSEMYHLKCLRHAVRIRGMKSMMQSHGPRSSPSLHLNE